MCWSVWQLSGSTHSDVGESSGLGRAGMLWRVAAVRTPMRRCCRRGQRIPGRARTRSDATGLAGVFIQVDVAQACAGVGGGFQAAPHSRCRLDQRLPGRARTRSDATSLAGVSITSMSSDVLECVAAFRLHTLRRGRVERPRSCRHVVACGGCQATHAQMLSTQPAAPRPSTGTHAQRCYRPSWRVHTSR